MWIRAALWSSLMSSTVLMSGAAQQAVAVRNTANARVRLDFDGGTLLKYVEEVRGTFDKANIVANIVIDGDSLNSIPVPKAPIRWMSLPQSLLWVTTTVGARKHALTLQPTRAAGDSADVFVLTVARAAAPRPEPVVDTVIKDYALDSIPNRPDWPDNVLNAVTGKIGKHGHAELVAGRPRLLRVSGTRMAIQDADQTVAELERGVRPATVLPQLQAEVSKLRTQVDSLRSQMTEVLRRLPPDSTKH